MSETASFADVVDAFEEKKRRDDAALATARAALARCACMCPFVREAKKALGVATKD